MVQLFTKVDATLIQPYARLEYQHQYRVTSTKVCDEKALASGSLNEYENSMKIVHFIWSKHFYLQDINNILHRNIYNKIIRILML